MKARTPEKLHPSTPNPSLRMFRVHAVYGTPKPSDQSCHANGREGRVDLGHLHSLGDRSCWVGLRVFGVEENPQRGRRDWGAWEKGKAMLHPGP